MIMMMMMMIDDNKVVGGACRYLCDIRINFNGVCRYFCDIGIHFNGWTESTVLEFDGSVSVYSYCSDYVIL